MFRGLLGAMGQKAISFNSEKTIVSCALKGILRFSLMALDILKTTIYGKLYHNLDRIVQVWPIHDTFYSSMSDKKEPLFYQYFDIFARFDPDFQKTQTS